MSIPTVPYRLRLYVAGGAARSRRAVETVSRLCATRLPGRSTFEVIDVQRQPERARREGIVGVPALVRLSPTPVRRIVGGLSDETRICSAILEPLAEEPAASYVPSPDPWSLPTRNSTRCSDS